MKTIILGISILILTGCATNPDSRETITKHKSMCHEYGLEYKTTAFAECMLSLRGDLIDRNDKRREAIKRIGANPQTTSCRTTQRGNNIFGVTRTQNCY